MGTNDHIRIVIADDRVLLREGLVYLISQEADLEVVGESSSAADTIDVAKDTQADILLLDLLIPGIDEMEIISLLRERRPELKILVMTDGVDQEFVLKALLDGAKGYVSNRMSCRQVIAAIRAVYAGEAWIERSTVSQLLEELPLAANKETATKSIRSESGLSQREIEVASLVASGCSNKEIAYRLSISEKTVKTHLINIFRKLQVQDRLQLALYMHNQSPSKIKNFHTE